MTRFDPAPLPLDSNVSQWFKNKIAGWLGATFQAAANAVNAKQHVVAIDPASEGLTGQPDNDEGPQLQRLLDKVPDRSAIFLPTLGFQTRTQQLLEIRGATGKSIVAPSVLGGQDLNPQITTGVRIIYDGPAGVPALSLWDSQQILLEGIGLNYRTASAGVVMDQSEGHRNITSQNMLRRVMIYTDDPTRRDGACLSLSPTSPSNIEYITLEDVYLIGGRTGRAPIRGADASMATGDTVVTFAVTTPDESWIGDRFLIAGAGAYGIGKALDADVVELVGPQSVRLSKPALANVSSAAFMAREYVHTGLRNGRSYNAKSQNGTRVHFINLGKAIESLGGSIHMTRPNFVACGVNWWLEGAQSESSSETRANSEGSGQHLVYAAGPGTFPFESRMPRLDVSQTFPGCGYITIQQSPSRFGFATGSFEGAPYIGSTVFDLTYPGIAVELERMAVPWFYTRETMGFDRIGRSSYAHSIDGQQSADPLNPDLAFYGGDEWFGDPEHEIVHAFGGRVHLPAPTSERRRTDLLAPGAMTFEVDLATSELLTIVRLPNGQLATRRDPLSVLPDHLQPG